MMVLVFSSPMCSALYKCTMLRLYAQGREKMHWHTGSMRSAPDLCATPQLYAQRFFASHFWRISWCPNWAHDRFLKISLSWLDNRPIKHWQRSIIAPKKVNSPKNGQQVQNEGAKMKYSLIGNFWSSSSTPHWVHDSSLEIWFCLVIIWLTKKVIWRVQIEEKVIFPKSLQKCSNSLVETVFLTFI